MREAVVGWVGGDVRVKFGLGVSQLNSRYLKGHIGVFLDLVGLYVGCLLITP